MSFKRKKKKCKNAKLCSLRLDKGCCGLCAGMFVDKSMPAAVISLIFFRQIGAVTDRRLKFFWKNILTVERGTKVGRGRPPEKQSSLTAVIESILLKNVHIIYFSYFSQIEKARLSLRCDRWSADGGEGVEGGAQCRPRISCCEPAAGVSRGCFHDYANSGLNFYFEATVESVFEEQERDWSNNKILKHKINWKERKKHFEFRKEGNDTINIFMMSCDDKRNYLLFFFYSFWMVCVHSLMFSLLWFMNSTLLRSFHEIVFACVKNLLLEICKDLYMSAFSKGTY